jgi:ADP-ribose pyrophosphatase YjhB (NUDIX family)
MMITFDTGKGRFNHRAAGVLIDDGHVLLHRLETDDFWALPGGRIEFMENSKETIKREMQEEIGIEVQVGRLLFVVENYFDHQDKPFHEVAFYFLLTADKSLPIFRKDVEHAGDEFGKRLIYKWFRLEDLPGLRIYPTFLKERLQQLPPTPLHLVHVDEE